METKINKNMKRSSSSNSESQTHLESPHSPLRFHSPLQSEHGDPPETPPYASPYASPEKPQPKPKIPDNNNNSKAIVAVNKSTQYSPLQIIPPPEKSKPQPQLQPSPENAAEKVVYSSNRAVREEVGTGMRKVGPGGGEVGAIVRRSKRGEMVKLAALGFRISEVVLCLISFSVLAADKTQGWSGDSFDRYKEYRYCLSVNVIAFAYSGFQAYDLAYFLVSGKHVIRHYLRCHFDFFMDQILAYLLISASSSAATRVDDWQSNWGKDQFTEMASASVAMAFLAFIAFAISSLISGFNLCTLDST